MNRFFLVLIVIIIFIVIVSFILGVISQCPPLIINGFATCGEPFFFENDSIRWGEITDFAVCDKRLYILYGNKSILDCYSLDGDYLHSYFVELGKKGRASLFVKGNTLYLKSNGLNFYTFSEGYYVKSYVVSATELYSEIEKLTSSKHEVNGIEYELRGASIWQNELGKSEMIVHRPAYLVVFQGYGMLLIGSIAFLLLCYLLHCLRKSCQLNSFPR